MNTSFYVALVKSRSGDTIHERWTIPFSSEEMETDDVKEAAAKAAWYLNQFEPWPGIIEILIFRVEPQPCATYTPTGKDSLTTPNGH